MQVHAPLRNERVKPEAKLTHVHIPVRPVAPSGGKASLMEPLATSRGETVCLLLDHAGHACVRLLGLRAEN